MPLYEYQCEKCGHRFEKIQKFSDALETVCPKCGGGVHKLMSSPAIQFKGSGFYITDYAKKDQGSEAKAATKAKADATADAKSDNKADTAGGAGKAGEEGKGKEASTSDTKADKSDSKAASSDTTPPPQKT